MNENIDLTKILKNCPKGWKFYSSVLGEVSLKYIIDDAPFPIIVTYNNGNSVCTEGFKANGKMRNCDGGECVLFPSRDQHDWAKFSAPWYNKNEKFNPKTLQPFDKIIARIDKYGFWCCELFSFIEEDTNLIKGCGAYYKYCVPYNNDTKHLIGTAGEAPGYYKYWED